MGVDGAFRPTGFSGDPFDLRSLKALTDKHLLGSEEYLSLRGKAARLVFALGLRGCWKALLHLLHF